MKPSIRHSAALLVALAAVLLGRGASAAEPGRGFWIGAVLQGDVALLPGGDICSRASQSEATYSCFRADREQYVGVPAPAEQASFDVSYGTTRVALHAERALFGNFTAGGRFGFAFGGGPTPAKGPPFVPLHLEARLAYWIGPRLSPEPGLYGFVTVLAGIGQVDAVRRIDVTECRPGVPGCAPATNVQPGGPNPDEQELEAWGKAGQGFAGLGGGLYFSFVRGSGAVLELKAMQLFPGVGVSLSPSLGYVFHVF